MTTLQNLSVFVQTRGNEKKREDRRNKHSSGWGLAFLMLLQTGKDYRTSMSSSPILSPDKLKTT